MKKALTIISVALFGATLGFACGGGQQPAAESTLPTPAATDEATPASTEAPVDNYGGNAYGGAAYGGAAYGGGEAW